MRLRVARKIVNADAKLAVQACLRAVETGTNWRLWRERLPHRASTVARAWDRWMGSPGAMEEQRVLFDEAEAS